MRSKVHYEWLHGSWWAHSDGEIGAATFIAWLTGDIQYSETTIDWFFDEIARAAKGELPAAEACDFIDLEPRDDPHYLGTGNSMSCFANSKFFYIECLYADECRVIMTIEQVREALAHYKLFTLGGWDDPQTTPESFEFEYVAEGVEATRLAIEAGLISSNSQKVG